VRRDEPALDVGVVGDRGRQAEHLAVDVEVNRGLVVRGRHEQAARRRDPQPKHGRRIEIGEEDQRVELLVAACQVIEQRRAPRPLLRQPLHLVVAGVGVVEDPIRQAVERVDVAGPRGRESPHGDPAHAVGPLGILVLPGDVVARAGGQHLHLVTLREPLCDQTAAVLGSAEDLRAVALDDEGEFHDVSSVSPRAVDS
jgi:hypothetical protein